MQASDDCAMTAKTVPVNSQRAFMRISFLGQIYTMIAVP
jgi:hypothetical protein